MSDSALTEIMGGSSLHPNADLLGTITNDGTIDDTISQTNDPSSTQMAPRES